MSKSRKQEKANSLETLLVKIGQGAKENREKISQGILLVLIVVLAVLFLRFYFYGKPQKFQGDFDQAYYFSTQSMMSPAPSATPYEELATQFTKGNEGAAVRVAAAEALLKTGQAEVDQKKAASEAKTASAEVIAMNPEKTFTDAVARFEQVTGTSMATDRLLAARALFGCGAAYENLAAVTAGEDQVALKLDSAKACYQKILDQFAETAFAAQAKTRLDRLAGPITVAYYQKSADQFLTMPEPELAQPQESILSENGDPLDPNAEVQSGEDFALNPEGEETNDVAAPEEKPAETEANVAEPEENTADSEEAKPAE